MARRIPMFNAMKDAERASKRLHFDPADVARKPKLPWLDLEVGQSFKVSFADGKRSGLESAAWRWSNRTGRVFSVHKQADGWEIKRTE